MADGDLKTARSLALRALGRRMHTTWEIRSTLSRRGYKDDTIECVVVELTTLAYLDDLEFAKAWVSSRSVHQLHGRRRLLSDLRKKGISSEVAESAVNDRLGFEDELLVARKAAEKKHRTLRVKGTKGRDAVYRYLRSRGFSSRIISLAVSDLVFEEEPP